jgi:hypothetical protein
VYRVLILFLVLTSQAALAEPVVLTCDSDDGQTIPIEIDIEGEAGKLGSTPLAIVHLDDQFVTFSDNYGDGAGGSILVIDRKTGEWRKVYVGMSCERMNCSDTTVLDSYMQRAVWKKALF